MTAFQCEVWIHWILPVRNRVLATLYLSTQRPHSVTFHTLLLLIQLHFAIIQLTVDCEMSTMEETSQTELLQ